MATKKASLSSQFNFILQEMESLGESRHEAKKNGDSDSQIFSMASYDAVQKFTSQFSPFLKSEGVRYLRDITPEHFEKFISQKISSGEIQKMSTLKTYISQFNKVQAGMAQKGWIDSPLKVCQSSAKGEKFESYTKIDFEPYYSHIPDFKNVDFQRLLADFQIRDCITGLASDPDRFKYSDAFIFQAYTGLREAELAQIKPSTFSVENGSIYLKTKGKGGRWRDIEIPAHSLDTFFSPVLERIFKTGYLVEGFQKKGYTQGFASIVKAYTGLDSRKTHDLRKYFACQIRDYLVEQKERELCRRTTLEERVQIEITVCSTYLAHGAERQDMNSLRKKYMS